MAERQRAQQQSRVEHRFIIAYYPAWATCGTGTHRQSLPCHLLTEQSKHSGHSQSVRPPVIWVIRSTNQSTTSIKQQSIGSLINSSVARSLTQSLNLLTTHSSNPLSGLLLPSSQPDLFPHCPHLASCILHLASIQSNPIQSGPVQSSPPPPSPLLPQINSLRQALPNFLPHTPLLPPPPTGPSPPDPGDRLYNKFKNNLQPSGSPPTHCLEYLRDHGKATLCLSENNPPWPPDTDTPSNLVPTPALLADPAVDLHLAQSTANPSFAATSCFVAQHLCSSHTHIFTLSLPPTHPHTYAYTPPTIPAESLLGSHDQTATLGPRALPPYEHPYNGWKIHNAAQDRGARRWWCRKDRPDHSTVSTTFHRDCESSSSPNPAPAGNMHLPLRRALRLRLAINH